MVLELSGFDQTWRPRWSVSAPLILKEVFSSFDKNLLGIFKFEHTKTLSGFMQIGLSIKVDWVNHF